MIRNKLVLRNHFLCPICHLLHEDKELLALRNNFRETEKFLITKFDCTCNFFQELFSEWKPYMANIVCKSWKVVKVQVKKNYAFVPCTWTTDNVLGQYVLSNTYEVVHLLLHGKHRAAVRHLFVTHHTVLTNGPLHKRR